MVWLMKSVFDGWSMVERTKPLTLQEFIHLYDESPFEIIDGRWLPVSPTLFGHGNITKRIFSRFLVYEQSEETGETFFEVPFVLVDSPNWVAGSRVPDVMFIRKERLTDYRRTVPDFADKPLILVPDIVVEVVSPTDSYSEVNSKVDSYLADGVKIIWVFDPQRKRVTEYRADNNQPREFGFNDILSGRDIAPAFELKISDIFSE